MILLMAMLDVFAGDLMQLHELLASYNLPATKEEHLLECHNHSSFKPFISISPRPFPKPFVHQHEISLGMHLCPIFVQVGGH